MHLSLELERSIRARVDNVVGYNVVQCTLAREIYRRLASNFTGLSESLSIESMASVTLQRAGFFTLTINKRIKSFVRPFATVISKKTENDNFYEPKLEGKKVIITGGSGL